MRTGADNYKGDQMNGTRDPSPPATWTRSSALGGSHQRPTYHRSALSTELRGAASWAEKFSHGRGHRPESGSMYVGASKWKRYVSAEHKWRKHSLTGSGQASESAILMTLSTAYVRLLKPSRPRAPRGTCGAVRRSYAEMVSPSSGSLRGGRGFDDGGRRKG